jgi:hypothetical protein
MLQELWTEWVQWWADVPRQFAFLLCLPLLVAASAFLAEAFKRWRPGKRGARDARTRSARDRPLTAGHARKS